MSGFGAQRFDETPITWIVLLAYVTMAFLTDLISPTTRSLVEHGAAAGLLVQDEPWRLFSYAFLHGGLLHLGFNSYFLFLVGPQLERAIGSPRFAGLYIAGALGGGIGGTLWNGPVTPLVGGSGALFAMMGALVALMMRRGRTQLDFLAHHGARNILMLIVVNLALGWMLPMVSNSAHIGGLIAGFTLVYVFLERGRAIPDATTRAIQAGWIAVTAAMLLWCTSPVPRWDWHLRGSAHAATAELRDEHARALRAMGMPAGALEQEFRGALPKMWGEPGRKLVARWFD